MAEHPLIARWRTMHWNCKHNPRYIKNGIAVCDRWSDFRAWIADIGDPPTNSHQFTRIDLKGPFCPENCRWAIKLSGHPLYSVWYHMHRRCKDSKHKQYVDYGGRGIYVCARWQCLESFIVDMGDRPSSKHELDRIDNDGPYSPKNCRWATRSENQNNKRYNHYIEYNGRTLTAAQWSRELGGHEQLVWQRAEKLGWTAEMACTIPPRVRPRARPLDTDSRNRVERDGGK